MKINYLEYKLFSKLNSEDLAEIDRNSQLISVQKGEVIHFEQEECISLELIVNGLVHLEQIDEQGNTLVVREYDKGNYIGSNLLFSFDNQYMLFVIADADTVLYRMPKTIIESKLSISSFRKEFIHLISNNSIFFGHHIKQVYRTSLRQKIQRYLETKLQLSQSNTIILTSSKTALSKQFGVERTSLSRELQKMKQEGLIDYDRCSITVIKPNRGA